VARTDPDDSEEIVIVIGSTATLGLLTEALPISALPKLDRLRAALRSALRVKKHLLQWSSDCERRLDLAI